MGQRHGAPPAPGPDAAARAGASHRARPGRVPLQRGGAASRPASAAPPSCPRPPCPGRERAGVRRDRRPDEAGARWLSVGRLAPNKAIELAVMALLVTRAHDDPAATLEVVGRPVVPAYTAALQRFVDELGLHARRHVRRGGERRRARGRHGRADVLVGDVPARGLRRAGLRGDGVGLPVVANAAGALPEVVGDAGVLVDARDPYAAGADAAARCRRGRGASRRTSAGGRTRASTRSTSRPPATGPPTSSGLCARSVSGRRAQRRRRPAAPA